jgi:hypothetical protein
MTTRRHRARARRRAPVILPRDAKLCPLGEMAGPKKAFTPAFDVLCRAMTM